MTDGQYQALKEYIRRENERIVLDQHTRSRDAKIWGVATAIVCVGMGMLIGRWMQGR